MNEQAEGNDGVAEPAVKSRRVWDVRLILQIVAISLSLVAITVSSISAYFAWQNNILQVAASKPHLSVTNVVALSNKNSDFFEDMQIKIDYKNAGGSSSSGVRIELKQVNALEKSPTIAADDDGVPLARDDLRYMLFNHVKVAAPQTALAACFYIGVLEPIIYSFSIGPPPTFAINHLRTSDVRSIEALSPCKR